MNADDEEIQVKLKLKGQDATYEDISKESKGSKIKERKSFKVYQNIIKSDWIFTKWLSSKSNSQKARPSFSISKLEFDPESGEIVSGEGTLEGINTPVTLVPANMPHIKRQFAGERAFKLTFESQDE